ncbi:uncharacterized protein A1O5_13433 [Cladophialophora psammophila CBS 110553]|uniref:F-box domain-containing protein n=1 Tax=Cladophialophora psammophila CBS 110553 TaxID=1182543 RepID=W9W456_9EURO|nr:uncharacterized protein A1O5_13433 [Cladophialophora psammophila CBS 110553]EXJ53339.1 hypothetical protein A1O5_13433 [Cladophialophora psammophila CBS 110553]
MAAHHLQLAVFSSRLYGVMAFISSRRSGESHLSDAKPEDYYDCDDDDADPRFNQHIVEASLPRPIFPVRRRPRSKVIEDRIHALALRHVGRLIRLQNSMACSVLSTPTLANLQTLTLYMYDLMSPNLTSILATFFPNLQELHLGFCHPYIHDSCLPPKYWTHPNFLEPTTLWDVFGGIGVEHAANLRLKRLKKLTLERSGINRTQLQKWIQRNPDLTELRLRHVAGVDAEFVQWLSTYYHSDISDYRNLDVARPAELKVLALENCATLSLQSLEDMKWLDPLFNIPGRRAEDHDKTTAFQILSFRESTSVSTSSLMQYLAIMRPNVRQVTLPDSRVLIENTNVGANAAASSGVICGP